MWFYLEKVWCATKWKMEADEEVLRLTQSWMVGVPVNPNASSVHPGELNLFSIALTVEGVHPMRTRHGD